MKRFTHRLTRAQALRMCIAANEADGLTNGKRGEPAPGQKPHPKSPETWDGTGPTPAGWTAPHRPEPNPRVPGEYLVRFKGSTAARVARMATIPSPDRDDFKTRFDAGDTRFPPDYRDADE